MRPSSSPLIECIVLTNEDVHHVRCRGHNDPKDEYGRTHDSDISATHEIGEGAHEGADGCQGKKVGQDLSHDQYADYIRPRGLLDSQTMSIYPCHQCR